MLRRAPVYARAVSSRDWCRTLSRQGMDSSQWELFVTNIGKVGCFLGGELAVRWYYEYMRRSVAGEGRGGGETVILWRDGDVFAEYVGELERDTGES